MQSKTAIVKFSDLGTNCWLPQRFIKGTRCQGVFSCKYPEKKTCQAVQGEIVHLAWRIIEVGLKALDHQEAIGKAIAQLMQERKK